MLSKELLEILACPACESRPPVRPNEDETELVCTECGRRYPVREGIPVMLVDAVLPVATARAAKA
jgi:uncharacterized protein YbaR (Trm112 family)